MRHHSCHFLLGIIVFLSGCSDSGTPQASTSRVDLSFSDAAVDSASEVVITVDTITLQGNGEDIVIETFFNADTGLNDAETYQIDLLQVQGTDSLLVADSIELPVGNYSDMRLDILDENTEASYVTDANGRKELKVPSGQLKLGAFSVNALPSQSMVVEFGLAQSMTYNPGPDRYILKPRGVRIVAGDTAATIAGTINHALLQQSSAECVASSMDTGGTMGSVYLYSGHDLPLEQLADNFMVEDGQDSAELFGRLAPLASSNLDGADFVLSFLEPGDYTMAVSCHAQQDLADSYQGFSVPNPSTQLLELSLAAEQTLLCSIPLSDTACSVANAPE